MKTTAILLFSLAAIFTLALFYNIKTERVVKNNMHELMTSINDPDLRHEFVDSLKKKYPDLVLTAAFEITDHNRGLQSEMMNQMVAMCYSEPAMSKMMMGMAMSMCDIDKEKCAMMSEMMINHKETMKCMMNMMHAKGIIDEGCMNRAMKKIDKTGDKEDIQKHAHP